MAGGYFTGTDHVQDTTKQTKPQQLSEDSVCGSAIKEEQPTPVDTQSENTKE